MEEKLIKKFMTSIKCSVCGQSYEVDCVEILGHQEDVWFLDVFCPFCETECLVAALINGGKNKPRSKTRMRAASDLTTSETGRFKNIGKPSKDDMLDMHNFLKEFNGEFDRLFAKR
jgi:hypothetical protein